MKDLYLIQSHVTGAVKIGRSSNVERRLRQLQTGSPYLLRIILHLPGQGDIEKRLHHRLEPHKLKVAGEWFAPECLPDLPDEIYELLDLEEMEWWQRQ